MLTETEMGVLPLNTEPIYLMTKKHARLYYLAINSSFFNRVKAQILLEKEIYSHSFCGIIKLKNWYANSPQKSKFLCGRYTTTQHSNCGSKRKEADRICFRVYLRD